MADHVGHQSAADPVRGGRMMIHPDVTKDFPHYWAGYSATQDFAALTPEHAARQAAEALWKAHLAERERALALATELHRGDPMMGAEELTDLEQQLAEDIAALEHGPGETSGEWRTIWWAYVRSAELLFRPKGAARLWALIAMAKVGIASAVRITALEAAMTEARGLLRHHVAGEEARAYDLLGRALVDGEGRHG